VSIDNHSKGNVLRYAGIVAFALLVCIPLLGVNAYLEGQVILFLLFGAVAVQWNLLFGFSGIFSLATLAMFGIGAYGMAMFNFYLQVPVWLAIPFAGLLSMAVSVLLGLATLRLTGVYTALMTLAFAQVVNILVLTDVDCFTRTDASCRQLTGGPGGFYGFDDFGTREAFGTHWLAANYYIIFAAVLAIIALTLVLTRSSVGIALTAMRDNPRYAQALGVNKLSLHLKVFAISSLFTGVLGALYAAHVQSISPTIMSMAQMLYLVAAVVLGGAGRFWAPVVGLALMMGADELLRDYGSARQIGIGLILMLSPLVFRSGLLGTRRSPPTSR
jgi:branched-chain amino acid transport system permease protein